MLDRLSRRAAIAELMDDLEGGGPELTEALRHLRRLNRIFGAAGPVVYGVRRLWTEAGQPRRISILDVGSGSGDVNRAVLRWADLHEVACSITLSDVTPEACSEARRIYREEPRVTVMQADLFQLPAGSADIVTASQFIHHFATEQLPDVLRTMLHASRVGIVLNDIHRHWIPWSAVWISTRLISRNRYIRHDGPLSVAKGFRSDDWKQLQQAPGLSNMSVYWRPLFRYAVIVRRGNELERWWQDGANV